jgi:hypothetical protein
LGEDHTRMIAQVHHLLLELIPGGAKKDLSAAQAKALLAKFRPRDAAGKTRRRVAAGRVRYCLAENLDHLVGNDKRRLEFSLHYRYRGEAFFGVQSWWRCAITRSA